MRFGCCGDIDDAGALAQAGFDYLEVNVQAVLRPTESEADWQRDVPDPSTLALPIEAANCLMPQTLPLIGPGRDWEAIGQYMQRVADRSAKLGIRRVIFGSGKARMRPTDVPVGVAAEQLAAFCAMAGEMLAAHDILLIIEHLNRKESNTINTLAQELELIERTSHSHVAGLVDSYHFALEGENEDAILNLGDYLRHVHVAEPAGRLAPGSLGDSPDAYDFESFFCVLRKLGYDERISVEAQFPEPADVSRKHCVTYLKEAWRAAARCESNDTYC